MASRVPAREQASVGALKEAREFPPRKPPPLIRSLVICGLARKCGLPILTAFSFCAIMMASFVLLLTLSPLFTRGSR